MKSTAKSPFNSNARLTITDDRVNGGAPTQATYVSWTPARSAFVVAKLECGAKVIARVSCTVAQ